MRIVQAQTPKHIHQIRVLNDAILPVKYDEEFYKKLVGPKYLVFIAVTDESDETRTDCKADSLQTQNNLKKDSIVAAILCVNKIFNKRLSTYIMSLTVAPFFRRRGLATALIHKVQQQQLTNPHICGIYLHTQINNSAAIKLYKSLGFILIKEVPNYYDPSITPRQAFILHKNLKAIRRRRKKTKLKNV